MLSLLGTAVAQARKRGREKLVEQRAEYLARCLLGGASKAHKMANADNLLPPLRLVGKSKDKEGQVHFINYPLEIAKHYSNPWKKQWNSDDPDFAARLGANFQHMRKTNRNTYWYWLYEEINSIIQPLMSELILNIHVN